MKKNTYLGIIVYLFCVGGLAYGADPCSKCDNEDPELVLQCLKADYSPESQLCLAQIYYVGIGNCIKKDVSEAVKWFRKAADQGNPIAQTSIGVIYLKGEGVSLNKSLAYQYILKAANQDYARAQYYLGGLYYEGNGIDKDFIEAIKWFKKAADQEYKEAQDALKNLHISVGWKKEIGNLKGNFILLDKSNKIYPNESHASGELTKENYLNLKAGDEFIARIGIAGCNRNNDGECTETADIWLFAEDWTLIKEIKDAGFVYKNNAAYIFMTLKIDSSDSPGRYVILARIKENGKQQMELSQMFWVKDKNAPMPNKPLHAD